MTIEVERRFVRRRVQAVPVGESRVEQSHRAECDINAMMTKYNRTGLLPGRGSPGFYGDFSGVSDYHSACNAVLAAERAFNALPSKIRKRFANDPAELISFVENADNKEEAIELGILPKEPEPSGPVDVNIVNPENLGNDGDQLPT